MITTYYRTRHPKKQQGAALVVGLILLVAITLMAVASMNTATLDLMMAANEQYHSRSFYAAEAAVEAAITNDDIDAFDNTKDYPLTTAVSTGTGNDNYRYSITRPQVGMSPPGTIVAAPSSSSLGTFGAVHFGINASGRSERGAITTIYQEVVVIVKASNEVRCVIEPCTL